MAENEYGYIRVTVRAADGALPLERAIVTVKDGNESILAVFFTDEDGNTPPLKVLAPPKENSGAPGVVGPAFYVYNIDTDKVGYRSVRNIGVPVYPGVTSVQPVEMVPRPENSEGYFGDSIKYNESSGAPEL